MGRGTVTFKSTESSVAATTNGDLIARGEGNLSITSGSTLAFDGGSEFHLSADPSAFDSVNYDDGVDGLMSFTATTTEYATPYCSFSLFLVFPLFVDLFHLFLLEL